MIYTGLDWSGDPGDPMRRPGASSLLIAVAVSAEDVELPRIRTSLAKVRATRRLPEDHPFKHLNSKRGVTRAFFEEIAPLSLRVHAKVVEKRDWPREYVAATDGLTRTVAAIIDLVCCCPDDVVARQVLMVDLDRGAARELRIIRTSLRRALTGIGRQTFENVKASPDHLPSSELVQIADMIAGELREHNGTRGPLLDRLGRKLVICV